MVLVNRYAMLAAQTHPPASICFGTKLGIPSGSDGTVRLMSRSKRLEAM